MTNRILLVALASSVVLTFALMAGVAAGYLARCDRATHSTSLTRAAIAFAATLTLAATVTNTLTDLITP